MKKGIVAVTVIAALYAISWAMTCGIIKLITLCFALKFSFLVATGIWLILCAVKLFFSDKRGE